MMREKILNAVGNAAQKILIEESSNGSCLVDIITRDMPFETGDMGPREYGENIREFIERAR